MNGIKLVLKMIPSWCTITRQFAITIRCEPPQVRLQISIPWSRWCDQRNSKIPCRFKICSHLSTIWCGVSNTQPERKTAGGWRGSAARQICWLSPHIQSRNGNADRCRPRAMYVCLIVRATSIKISIQGSQLLQATTTFTRCRIEGR